MYVTVIAAYVISGYRLPLFKKKSLWTAPLETNVSGGMGSLYPKGYHYGWPMFERKLAMEDFYGKESVADGLY